jgi:AraC-like DNA-binding protein
VARERAVRDTSTIVLQSRALPLFLRRARTLALETTDLYERFGIAPSAADEAEVAIGLVAFRTLSDELAKRAGDSLFGFRAALDGARGHYGVIEYLVRNAPDVRAIIGHVVRFGRTINAQMRFEFDPATGRVMQTIPGAPECLGKHGNEYALSYQMKIAREAAGHPFAPSAVWFAHARAGADDELVRFFGTTSVTYRAGYNGLEFSPDVLALPISSADPALLELLADRARETVAGFQDTTDLDVLRRAISDSLGSGEITAEHLARRLGVSERTLHRRLEEEGTSLRTIVDEIRHFLALSYLGETERTVDDVGLLLGYSDARAFSRAFRRWTGTTPLAHRKKLTPPRPAE